jgi:hypothetical protein
MTTCHHLLVALNCFSSLEKNKEHAKNNIVPSTTKKGTDVPSWPHSSPKVATPPAIK